MPREPKLPGILSVIKISSKEREVLLDYLNASKPTLMADYFFAVLGDEYFLKFFDVFSGKNIKVPSRDEILKLVQYSKIYSYLSLASFSEEAYERAASIFGKRVASLKRIVAKVDSVLNKLEDDENE